MQEHQKAGEHHSKLPYWSPEVEQELPPQAKNELVCEIELHELNEVKLVAFGDELMATGSNVEQPFSVSCKCGTSAKHTQPAMLLNAPIQKSIRHTVTTMSFAT